MSDPHWTPERAAWVLAHAGRNPAARRRGEQLASRARRATRYEAGVGDAAVGEVVTPNRLHRRIYKADDHKIARTIWAGVREVGRALVAGPGIAAAWGAYLLWWRQVSAWGPLRWKPVAFAAAGAVPVLLVILVAVAWRDCGVPLLGWYAMAQLIIVTARLSWLIRAYGWEAVGPMERAASGPRVAPIRIMTGTESPLPTTPSAQPTKRVVIRRKVTPTTPTPAPIPIIVRTEGIDQ
ncbi:hypothetical protein [Rhodococcus sp. 008]|uniref:hypothetical protein n=1 Tax=Rhodococcus sp. 008 TaxID=1723645 RepID=UPI00080639C4|nr:hypothetical protein [Rhodococcus sp. 008]ANQ74425.1 hypothetical protein AOT96_29120 [Rhodococcus sp. 008]